jgi:PIN domain nuclease of toxin-antitoxin system
VTLLLDTRVLLWWLADDAQLPDPDREAIADVRNAVAVSAASFWEIAIERALGRLETPDDLLDVVLGSGFETLDITPTHAGTAGALPTHHADPFDRMLIAQAQVEHLTLVTHDRRLADYEVALLHRP